MDCPACDSPVRLEVGPKRPLSTSLPEAVLAADEDERIEVTWNCRDCGWRETRQIRVEAIDTAEGNATTVDDEVRQLYERYRAAESDAERRKIALEMGKLDRRRHADIYAALEDE